MRLIKKINFLVLLTCCSISFAQKNKVIKPFGGIFLYSNQFIDGSIPQDVIFIPFNIDEHESVRDNIADCLNNTTKGYFIGFQQMSSTQPYYFNDPVSTTDSTVADRWITTSNLAYACKSTSIIPLKSIDFPVLGGSLTGESDVSAMVGKIICSELTAQYKEMTARFTREYDSLAFASTGIKPVERKKDDSIFYIDFEGKRYTLTLKTYGAFEYHRYAFIPLKN